MSVGDLSNSSIFFNLFIQCFKIFIVKFLQFFKFFPKYFIYWGYFECKDFFFKKWTILVQF